VRQVSLTSLRPLAALKAWLLKRRDVSPLLFRLRLDEEAAADSSEAEFRAPRAARPVRSRAAPSGPSGNTSLPHVKPPDVASSSSGYRDLLPVDVSRAFKAFMRAAGKCLHDPSRHGDGRVHARCFQPAVGSLCLLGRGINDPSAVLPDGSWIRKKLLEEQPALKVEYLFLEDQEQGGAEAEGEPHSTDSPPADESE
jgi:hypothetical protein